MGETNCTAVEYTSALTALEDAIGVMADLDPVMLSSAEVLDAMGRLENAARRVPYVANLLTKVADEQGLPGRLGYKGMKELLIDRLRLSGAEARERIRGSRSRAPRHERGSAPEPRYAGITEAQRAGAVSERHALTMERIFDRCRRTLTDSDMQSLEEILVTAAHEVSPDDLTLIGRRAIELIDPDGAEPKDQVIDRARELTIGPQDDDLMTTFGGALSPEGRALLDVIVDKFARPGMNNPADDATPVDPGDPEALREAARRDRRTAAQRNHDALILALRMAVTAGEKGRGLGRHRGLPCVPIITVRIDQLESETGIATTASGGRLPVADALRMMGTNPRYALLLDMHSRPLFLGREQRLASADQRIALYGSENGCTAPGCDAAATRCQVHHITEWADGGATDITSLTLACDAHHGKVAPPETAAPGWETVRIPAGEPYAGRTGWRRSADPSGEHRVNHSRHASELYQRAMEHWRARRQAFADAWRTEDLRAQYRDKIGAAYAEISALLDSPHGPPILERLLAEHDADNAWREPTTPTTTAAA